MHAKRKVYYGGRVQGVGFRYSVKQIASGYEVTGWVRNLPDGRVELAVSGAHEEVEAFIEAISESHLRTHIKEVTADQVEHDLHMPPGFEIRH